MNDVDVMKWILGLASAAIVALFKTVWKFPEKYVLKEDFNAKMDSFENKLDIIQSDIKQILKEGKK